MRRRLITACAAAAGWSCLASTGALWSGVVHAQPVAEVIAGPEERLIASLRDTQTLQANFSHEQASPSGRVMRFTGTLALARPGRFRWEVRQPYPQLQLIRGDEFLLFDPELAQVSVRKIEPAQMATPAGLLLLAGPDAERLIRERFELAGLSDRDGLSWVSVKPLEASESLTALEVGLDRVGNIAQFLLVDAMGRRSKVTLSAQRRNAALPAGLFDFKAPAGTEWLRPSM
jgi:outer membrane lipoprotein carrier protein